MFEQGWNATQLGRKSRFSFPLVFPHRAVHLHTYYVLTGAEKAAVIVHTQKTRELRMLNNMKRLSYMILLLLLHIQVHIARFQTIFKVAKLCSCERYYERTVSVTFPVLFKHFKLLISCLFSQKQSEREGESKLLGLWRGERAITAAPFFLLRETAL